MMNFLSIDLQYFIIQNDKKAKAEIAGRFYFTHSTKFGSSLIRFKLSFNKTKSAAKPFSILPN